METYGMKVVVNKLLPPSNFKILCIGKWMFVKPGTELTQKDYTHEATHFEQQKELLFIFFYIIYGIEWLLRFLWVLNGMQAYKRISFEQEAYENSSYKNWIQERPKYYWLKFWWVR